MRTLLFGVLLSLGSPIVLSQTLSGSDNPVEERRQFNHSDTGF